MKRLFKRAASLKAGFMLAFAMIMAFRLNAQVATGYTFSYIAGSYVNFTGGTSLGSGAIDDVNYTGVPIGFSFTYNGTAFTSCGVNTNGFIWFGGSTPAGATYTPISGTTGQTGVVSAFGFDLIGRVSNGNLRYQTTGAVGSRVFTVQWRGFRPYATLSDAFLGVLAYRFDVQIKLYETTNVIEFVYTYPGFLDNTNFAQVGLRGTTSADFNNRSVTCASTWATSTAGVANTSTCRVDGVVCSLFPATGATYRWTPGPPPAPPANDLCTAAISIPHGTSCVQTSGTVLNATQSLPASSCGGFTSPTANDVWYSFVAATTNPNIEVYPSSGMDAVVELYSGTCAGLTSLGCIDAALNGGTEFGAATGLVVGQTYLVRVYAYGTPTTSTFGICVYGGTFCTPPSFTTCPSAQSANTAAGTCSAVVNYTATAAGTSPTLTYAFSGATTGSGSGTGSGSTFNTGTTTVTITATNACGTANCTFSVIVTDNQNPTITCPVTQNIILDANCQAVLPDYRGLASTGDNCGVASVTQSPAIGTSLSGPGFVNVTLTVTDVNGLTANCAFVANKVDNSAPVITCPGTQTLTLGANCSVALPDYRSLATVVENCGTPTRSQTPAPGTLVSGTGSITVTLTATDGSGNTSVPCTFTVNKVDNTAPTAICQSITVNLDATGNASITASQVNNGSSDACGPVTLSATPTSFNCSNVSSPASSLFISEYIEGNSNNKAIEIYNGTGAAVNISGYMVRTYFNGSLAVGNTITIPAATILANGDVYVVAHGAANASILAQADLITSTGLGWYNGDDAVTLEAPGGIRVDIIGQIGCDPGTAWILGGNGTENRTIRRNANVLQGISVNPAGACGPGSFATLGSEWTGFPVDNSAGLGAHSTSNGPTPVVLTVTDGSGNSSNCTAFVTVLDITPPVPVCQNVSVNLDAAGNATVTAAQVNNGSSDACGIASLSLSQTAFTCANVGANPVTLTVTDVNGNSSSCNATVNVSDATPPNALCQNVTVNLDATGNASVTAAQVNNGSSDNCGIASITVAPNSFTCADVSFPGGPTNLIISEYVEGSGFNKYIEVHNPTSNPINLADYSLRLFSNGAAVPTSTASLAAAGILAPGGTAVFRNSGATLYAGTSFVNTAVNFNGDDAVELFQVSTSSSVDIFGRIGEDPDGAPNPGAGWVNGGSQTADRTLRRKPSVGGGVNVNPAAGFPTQVSQWDLFAQNTVAGLGTHSYTGGGNVVTLTVTDVNGNVSTCNATVTVFDVTPPTAICQNVTVGLNASGTGTVTAAQVNNGSMDACGIGNLSVSPSTFTCANVGANTVTLTVTDMTGNSSTCTATVTVTDPAAPNALCQDVTVNLDAGGNATVSAAQVDNGSNDACGIASMSVTPGAFTCADVAGDLRTDLIISEYVEGTGNNKCVELYNGTGSAINLAADNYVLRIFFNGSNIFGTSVTLTGTIPAGGTYVVCNSAADPAFLAVANQTSSASFYNGNDAVVLAKNGGSTVIDIFGRIGEDPGAGGWTGGASATTDRTLARNSNVTAGVTVNPNGGFPNLANQWTNFAVNTSSGLGSHTATAGNAITLTVTDVNGNSNSCTASVTVVDNVAPNAICQNVTVQLDATGNGSTTAAAVDNGSSDACGIASLSLSQTAFTCANVGANPVTLTVTDVNGNSSTCTATVTVQDNVAPVALCQNVTVQLDATGNGSTTAAAVNNGSSDACGIASLSLSQTAFTCANVGANTVTLTVTDVNGNSSTCTATVTVQDNIAPVALCQNVTVQLDATGNGSTTAAAVDNGSSDACGIASLSLSQTAFTCANVGANTVTLTVTDVNGNSSTCTATVTVQDNVAPVALCQNVTVQLDATGNGSTTAAAVNNGSSDACGIASLSLSQTAFTCTNVGANPVTLTVTDVNGNSSTCSATVTVQDNVAPNAICQNLTLNLSSSGSTTITAAQIDNGSSDACGIASLSVSPNTFDCTDQGANTVTLTVTDVNGNVSTCTAVVTVNVAPIVVSLSSPTYNCGFNISCNGNTDGSINSVTSGGCLPYTYTWSNGSTSANPSGLGAGTYTVTVQDVNGNTGTATIVLTQPVTLTATIVDAHSPPFACGFNISCNGASDGAVLAIPSGGCAPYSYLWSTGSTIQLVAGLPAGPVSVTITDANGCTTVTNYLLTQPDPVLSTAVISTFNCGYNVGCFGGSNGSVNQTVTGGCAPYSFIWSNGATTEDVSGLAAGTYSVTISDANNCTISRSYTLTQPTPVTVTCPANVTVFSGYTSQFGCATLTPTGVGGGCAPYTYAWSNGATTASITVCPTVSTNYTLTVTDANGCTATCVTRVCVINASCGNNGNKVLVCHIPPGNPGNANTLCIAAPAVANHLAHGDYIGPCGATPPCLPTPKTDEPGAAAASDVDEQMARFEAFPNPFDVSTTLQFSLPADEQVTLRVFSLSGVQVAVLFEGQVEANAVHSVEFKPEQVANGVYLARLETASGVVISRRLMLVK